MTNIRLISWNVNGIRASIKKGLWDKFITFEAGLLAIQETKSDSEVMQVLTQKYPEYGFYYHSASCRKGYSGVATISNSTAPTNQSMEMGLFEAETKNESSKELPTSSEKARFQTISNLQLIYSKIGLDEPKFDVEGRYVETKHQVLNSDSQSSFVLINCYYPQGGRGQHRIDYKIEFYAEVLKRVKELKKNQEKVILCGDFNTTVTDIDLARPDQNRQTTGCLPEEREALDWFFQAGFLDSFRYFYPDKPDVYTFWDQKTRARDRNVGWRIDYFLVDKELEKNLKSAFVLDQVMGSDHAPLGVDLQF